MASRPGVALPNPVFGPNPFKIGVFGYLHDGGNALTTVPERWRAEWDDIVALARLADRGGLDFMLPIARWKGVPGKVQNRLKSYETLTQAAALASVTERIGLFATVHTPIVHPIFAAKAMTTVDHASHGRAGVNIVCGWNQYDFDMFGFEQLEHDARYDQGREWFEIWSRLIAGEAEEFDYDGRYFPGLKGLIGQPPSRQSPRPAVISAAFSPAGRDFAVEAADILLTMMTDEDQGRAEIDDIIARGEAVQRQSLLQVFAVAYVVCRRTRREAETFHDYYAVDGADRQAVRFYVAGRSKQAGSPETLRELEVRWAGGNGGYPLVGTPQDVVDGMLTMQRAGFAGAALSFVHYLDELPFFLQHVLPLMEEAGLRQADTPVLVE